VAIDFISVKWKSKYKSTFAFPYGSPGYKLHKLCFVATYLAMAALSNKHKSPSLIAGTVSLGLIFVNSGACCSPFYKSITFSLNSSPAIISIVLANLDGDDHGWK
jgi:hypothetical protein